jgi:hypothetical protein
MGLSGIFTAVFLPMIITFFKWLSKSYIFCINISRYLDILMQMCYTPKIKQKEELIWIYF